MHTFSVEEKAFLIEAIEKKTYWYSQADDDFAEHLKACIRKGDFIELSYGEVMFLVNIIKNSLGYVNKICYKK